MPDTYSSHFSPANIPYGIASSAKRPTPQCVTRIQNTVIFLSELSLTPLFTSNPTLSELPKIFLTPTLNTFASLPKPVHLQTREAIKSAWEKNLHEPCSEDVENVTMHLPMQIGDFTDYSASANHVLNAGEAILGTRSFPPGFLNFPIAYAGRCSSIYLSGSTITRPLGQYTDFSTPTKPIIFGATRALDYELEVGVLIGRPVEPGTILHAKDADEHVFGFVLVNDWSARDIQGLEMNPLGPFNGKNFHTSISPWVVTLEALKPHSTPAPPRVQNTSTDGNAQTTIPEFLNGAKSENYDIRLRVEIIRNGVPTMTCGVNFNTMYWTFRHMLAHHTISGCGLRTGDLIASGTVSGDAELEHGCLLEFTRNGKTARKLDDGSELRYLEDGDVVRFTGVVGEGEGIGFGECVGRVGSTRKV